MGIVDHSPISSQPVSTGIGTMSPDHHSTTPPSDSRLYHKISCLALLHVSCIHVSHVTSGGLLGSWYLWRFHTGLDRGEGERIIRQGIITYHFTGLPVRIVRIYYIRTGTYLHSCSLESLACSRFRRTSIRGYEDMRYKRCGTTTTTILLYALPLVHWTLTKL